MSQSAGSKESWPRSRRGLFFGVLAGTLVFAVPLSYRQFQSPRPGIILYPILVLALSYLLAWALHRLAAHVRSTPPTSSEFLLLSAACLAGGHFSAWLCTLGPEIANNSWQGNILLVSLGTALISLCGALWSAFAVRALNQPNVSRHVLIVAGGIAIVIMWLLAEKAYWTFYANGTGRHRAFWTIISESAKVRYGMYGSIEAIYWQAAWPLLWVLALGGKFLRNRAEDRGPTPQ